MLSKSQLLILLRVITIIILTIVYWILAPDYAILYALPYALTALPMFFMGSSMILRSERKLSIYNIEDAIKREFIFLMTAYVLLIPIIFLGEFLGQSFFVSVCWAVLGFIMSAFVPPMLSAYLIYIGRLILE